jgi:hypothetical protein
MQHRRCFYLGLQTEPTLTFTEPTASHRCYATQDRRSIELSHQASFCLTTSFDACPQYGFRWSGWPWWPWPSQ